MKIPAEILVADIGSTLTKLCAYCRLDSDNPVFLGQGIGLTSVSQGDVSIGLAAASQDLEERFGIDTAGAELMAASSAAGGLQMSVHGLTPDMTLRAAREASLTSNPKAAADSVKPAFPSLRKKALPPREVVT